MREVIRQKIVDFLSAPIPAMTRRDIRIPRVDKKAIAVIGMRRTGKTTFMWQVMSDRIKEGVEREGLLYFSFEDERLAGMTVDKLQLLVEEYFRLHPEWRDRRKAVFFLDEIQNVPGWEAFTRRLLDTEQVELFISGSSAKLLSREVATSMRGRAMETLVHPFSFREYLRHAGREPETKVEQLPKASRSGLDKDLRTYLVAGGFPEAQGIDVRDRYELLRGYVDIVLLRDVVERYAVSQPIALRWLTRHLLQNAAGSFSIAKFHKDLHSQGINIGKDTLHSYLAWLEDAFLVRIVSIATDSERRRIVNPRKVYPIDPGLIPLFDQSGKSNTGHALESCVLLELERQGAEIFYVRTAEGYEVDFLARYPDGRNELIQVCTDIDSPETQKREIRALLAAKSEHPKASMHLILLQTESVYEMPKDVALHWATGWLLDADKRI